MDSPLPPAEELALIDRELHQIDVRRAHLLARRDWLLRFALGSAPVWPAPAPAPPAAATGGNAAGTAGAKAGAAGAQTVLLTAGAVLLAVAALAFTLLSWGSLGIGGRAAVLAVVTAAALGAPVVLSRRGLRSTAEAVAAVGLSLTVLDAYALHAVVLPDTDGLAYAAWAAAVLAALWAAYGAAAGRLWSPPLAAVAAGQLPLSLAAAASGTDAVGGGWALLATAALDVALAVTVSRRAVRVCAWAAAGVVGGVALLLGLGASLAAPGALAPAPLLGAGAALGVAVAVREPRAWPAALVGGLAAVAAVGALAPQGWGPGWSVALRVAAAAALAAALAPLRAAGPGARAAARGLLWAAAGVAALAAVTGVPGALVSALSRWRVLSEVWAPTSPAPPVGVPVAALAVTLLLTAVAGWSVARALPGRAAASVASAVAVVCAWAGLFVAPLAAGTAPAVTLGAQLVVTLAFGVFALRAPARSAVAGATAAVCALVGGVNVSVAALDGRLATFAVLGALGLAGALGAAYRTAPVPVRAGAAAWAVGCAAATVVALGALVGLGIAWTGVIVLAVPAAAVAVAPRTGRVRVAVEAAAVGVGVLAVLLASGDRPLLALVLALGGVLCAGAALRADRRAAGWAAGVLGVAATWVRLGASGVTVPEAYTLAVTVPALVVGLLRRRRDPGASSWAAYGPGLAVTLLPSLLAVWGDPYWPRPLLLGTAALVVTLLGAHRRLQAPLLLGGATLVAVAVHELAPYVVQVVGVLPRWLPPALAGVLLLAVGATYEKRLRDARRLREALGRLG
ncbi:hypothetical protein [Streptomyces sp. NPDC048606]|uniref:SCO7613 C-terminal domain-containing membrane protein n=1 Tax=Streptomyces sp. NPDC048606 TaxID=3154726 RepID=UPI00341AB7FE